MIRFRITVTYPFVVSPSTSLRLRTELAEVTGPSTSLRLRTEPAEVTGLSKAALRMVRQAHHERNENITACITLQCSIIIITTYQPDPELWEPDFRRGSGDAMRDL